jgi:penicillin-binding protein 2
MVVKRDVDRETALSIAANAVYLPGIIVDDNTLVRQYTGGPSFSHILGYIGPISQEEYEAATTPTGAYLYDPDDSVGRGGVEQALEEELRGEKGGRWFQVDSAGVERLELTDQRRDPVNGTSARLTIDRDFQNLVSQAVQDGIREAADRARKLDREPPGSGVAIVMNPQNGEILAMVSWPTFDNQLFVNGISQTAYDAYVNDPFDPLLDRAISGTYPPGSTLKPLLAVAGLQEEVINPDTKFRCLGNIRVPWTWDETQGNVYPCWLYDVGHGDVDIYRGISESCDVYFYNVGAPDQIGENNVRVHYYVPNDQNQHFFQGLGIEKIKRYLGQAYSFGVTSGIELAGEAEGLVPDPKWLLQNLDENWSVGDTINVSIGQGHLLCTPLQLLNGTAAIANGGRLYRPRLIKELIREDGTIIKKYPAQLIRDLTEERGDRPWFRPEHLAIVREGMRRTVTDPQGTGYGKITVSDVPIGAKSGTAEYGEAIDGKYKLGHAWFSAFAPFDNPEIAVISLVVGGYEGSTNAGPIANRILDAYFHQPGIREAAQQ